MSPTERTSLAHTTMLSDHSLELHSKPLPTLMYLTPMEYGFGGQNRQPRLTGLQSSHFGRSQSVHVGGDPSNSWLFSKPQAQHVQLFSWSGGVSTRLRLSEDEVRGVTSSDSLSWASSAAPSASLPPASLSVEPLPSGRVFSSASAALSNLSLVLES